MELKTLYIATLRQKQGELRALEMLEPQYKNGDIFIPNIIISDSSRETLQTILTKFDSTVILDTRDLTGEEIEELDELVNSQDFPNFHINYSIDSCLNNWPTENFNFVKIPKNLLNEFFVQWVQANATNFPENVMFDFEFVNEDLSIETLDIVSKIINILGNRNYIICSGAIPNTIPVSAETNYNLRRYEIDIFNQIIRQNTGNFIFSDYSTVSPLTSTGGRAIVQIKYTLETEYWFVRNGQRRGNYDFVNVCNQIVENANTFDTDSCWADQYIYDVHINRQNSGNPSIWASIGINKHIVICINEFTYVSN